jgi:IMP dehydrogenase
VKYDTPITVQKNDTVRDALGIIHKRSHGYVVLLDEENRPMTIFNERDLSDKDQFTKLGTIKRPALVTGNEDISDEDAFNHMEEHGVSSLPIVGTDGRLIGIMTKKNAVRNSVYSPTLDTDGKFDVAVALGINNFIEKARILIEDGIHIFVLDTAHGYQRKMIEAIKAFRKEF